MRHEAVIKLYPNVHNQVNDKAYDVNGNEVVVDEDAITKEVSKLLAEIPMKRLREERNQKLVDSDWTQYRDVTLSNDSDWQTYRQSLRDLPQNFSPIIDIITEDGYPIVKEQTDWPEKPE